MDIGFTNGNEISRQAFNYPTQQGSKSRSSHIRGAEVSTEMEENTCCSPLAGHWLHKRPLSSPPSFQLHNSTSLRSQVLPHSWRSGLTRNGAIAYCSSLTGCWLHTVTKLSKTMQLGQDLKTSPPLSLSQKSQGKLTNHLFLIANWISASRTVVKRADKLSATQLAKDWKAIPSALYT